MLFNKMLLIHAAIEFHCIAYRLYYKKSNKYKT